tara:strand:+ start:166 stop:468 length:303 start_codon:yes stop_codon:yes gene_type:complete
MKKFLAASIILFLIFFTAVIKNSTKRIDDEIFSIKENISSLKNDFENAKLEYDYLSSADRLIELQNLYFDNDLVKKDIKDIKIIIETKNYIKIKEFKFNE